MTGKALNPIGWGYLDDALSGTERESVLKLAAGWFGGKSLEQRAPPRPESVRLPVSRIPVPAALAECASTGQSARLLHARGRSFRDLAGLRAAELTEVTDLVATPRDADELARVLAWAAEHRYAVIPYGGGSSVVGGINAEGMSAYPGVVTLSLRGMNQVLHIDPISHTVHAQAGILGPDLDAALKPHGLAVRHFPQSYFHSTLGGWAATRGAGHFSTLHAKIEDRVQALGVTLPDGRRVETRRLPGSERRARPESLVVRQRGNTRRNY